MNRIFLIAAVLWVLRPASGLSEPPAARVNLDYVAQKAEARARLPFHSPRAQLPAFLSQMTYDQYREIEFRHEEALWAKEGLPFRVEFFHPGYLYQEPIHVSSFTPSTVEPVEFSPKFFNYRSLRLSSPIPPNTGFAGFRLLTQLNAPDKWDELGAFQGASYFRLLGQGQIYGMSARGLALDCGEDGRPEEFPIFTDFWLGVPQQDERLLLLYALLDSVSCTGAFEFRIKPGATTETAVEAVLYFRDRDNVLAADAQRKPLATIGFAPLTSMYWFGGACERRFDDYRPEVHDSEGLLLRLQNGKCVWRPLVNGTALRHQIFPADGIRGFGLLQRDRDFNNYQDIFHSYQDAPSAWVEPHGNWGDGTIHVVELSTQYEGLDNVVAFWNPAAKPAPLQPLRFGYTLYWTKETDRTLSTNEVVSTRVGINPRAPDQREFVIDFSLPQVALDGKAPAIAAICGTNGTVAQEQIFPNPMEKTWRVILDVLPKPGQREPLDVNCALKKGNEEVSETWTYHWTPP
ncbi:MAG: glucan biosynthesis protein [Limisphaerales bacterium]